MKNYKKIKMKNKLISKYQKAGKLLKTLYSKKYQKWI